MQAAKALVILGICPDSPEPSLLAYVISTRFSSAGSYMFFLTLFALNSCPAEPRFIFFENIVDPDQMASRIENTCLHLECYRLKG